MRRVDRANTGKARLSMDPILAKFLGKQAQEAVAFSAESDILTVQAFRRGDGPAQHFIARFDCESFVMLPDGQVAKHNRFDVGIYFPDDYLRQASTYQVLTWLGPSHIFHPNIRVPFVCVGEKFLRPGTQLIEILYQLHSVITYRKWASHSGLNGDACQWARNHQELFPVDPRPLKRRVLKLDLEIAKAEGPRP